MKNKIYEGITYLLAPPVFGVLVLFLFTVNSSGSLPFSHEFLIGLTFLFIIPLTAIVLAYIVGWSSDLQVSNRESRMRIYLIAIISYLTGALIFWYLSNYPLFLMFIAYVGVTSTMSAFNFLFKISAHTAGIAGPVTALVWMFGINYSLLYLLLIPVYFSRYRLNAHSPRQLMGGIIVSFIVTFAIFSIL